MILKQKEVLPPPPEMPWNILVFEHLEEKKHEEEEKKESEG